MPIRVGINGAGRIGRLVYQIMAKDPAFDVVAMNYTHEPYMLANLLKYDSTQGRAFDEVYVDGNDIVTDGQLLKIVADRDPANLPWKDLGVDVVIESTGSFTNADKARAHIDAGAKKVLITAPATNEDFTFVIGVNDDQYDPVNHNIVSNASCTTNCLAPVAKVLMDEFGINRGYINTIHAYTNDQRILDQPHKDLRRARAAALSMIPTSTGAARAVGVVLPELKGCLDGFATRVPTPTGSMVDLTAELKTPVTIEQINAAMKAASEGRMKGVLEYTEDPIVSIDIVHNPASAIFDAGLTMVLGGEGTFVKVVAWYDNEWGYSNRVADLTKLLMA